MKDIFWRPGLYFELLLTAIQKYHKQLQLYFLRLYAHKSIKSLNLEPINSGN